MVARRPPIAMGYPFRWHRCDPPGSPDVVSPEWREAIMVHGCFRHGHQGRRSARGPATHVE